MSNGPAAQPVGVRELHLTSAESGQRLDRYLRKLLPDCSLGAIFKLLRRGAIRVDGKKAKPDLRLEAGMCMRLPDSVTPRAVDEAPRQAAVGRRGGDGPEPRIVHRDDDLLVVEKPAGLATQPGSGHDYHVLEWLERQPFGVRTATFRPAPAHRLDRGTSGLLAIGLSPAGLRGLADLFRGDQVDKAYVAVVAGRVEPPRGTIDQPLLLRPNARAHQPKVVVDPAGRAAVTDYEVLEQGSGVALLRLVLHTGRTHQLRAHLAHIGHPIVGDRRYGTDAVPTSRGRAFLLHACELSLPHPVTGERLQFTAPPPREFQAALRLR